MKLAILSDLHIGDIDSRFAHNLLDVQNGAYQTFVTDLKNFSKPVAAKPVVDYLVLNGDVLDFSINSLSNSISEGRFFFDKLFKDKIAEKIIYIPGNHDHFIWDALEWETNIIGNLNDFRLPNPYKHHQPCIIEDDNIVNLVGISKPGSEPDSNAIFLKGLFQNANSTLPILVAYPNLYIKAGGEDIIVTHGHFFELAWTLISWLFVGSKYFPNLSGAGLKEIEEYNSSILYIICTGLGQSGAITDIFHQIQYEASKQDNTTLKKALYTLRDKLITRVDLPFPLNLFKEEIIDAIINKILDAVKEYKDTRNNEEFLQKDLTKELIAVFINATKVETDKLTANGDLISFRPTSLVFGHTHLPTVDNSFDNQTFPSLKIYNTGGWINTNKNGLIDPNKRGTLIYIDNSKQGNQIIQGITY